MTRTRRLLTGLLASGAVAMLGGCGEDGGMDPGPAPDDGLPEDVAAGMIQTWAGTGSPGFDGNGNPLLRSRFYWPVDMLITATGETYVLDWNNHRVRRVTAAGTFETVMGTDFIGDGPDDLSDLTQPGAPGTTIHLNHPTNMLQLATGDFLLTCWHNHKLRVWNPSTGLAYVMCGGPAGFAGDGGTIANARLNQPQATALAADGSLYILDQRNQRIRKIDASGNVTTVAGTGVSGFSGDGGSALAAEVSFPKGSNPPPAGGIAVYGSDVIYFSDILNNRVRRVDLAQDIIETIVGNGVAGYGGDGGPGTAASLNNPRDVQVGPDGRVYIADELNNRIRVWDPVSGIVTTVAGNGTAGFSGDGGPATDAQLYRPAGVEFDPQGRLYISDTYNHRIRRMRLEGN
jgi:sugar lactone lactonase YvrE